MNNIEELQSKITALEIALSNTYKTHDNEISNKHRYIEILEKEHAAKIAEKNEIIKSKNREIEKLEYALKGACQEHLNLRVSISPQLADQAKDMDLAYEISRNATRQLSSAVEKQLGDRYEIIKELDRAIKHIFYSEHHMSANLVKFTPFGMQQRFR